MSEQVLPGTIWCKRIDHIHSCPPLWRPAWDRLAVARLSLRHEEAASWARLSTTTNDPQALEITHTHTNTKTEINTNTRTSSPPNTQDNTAKGLSILIGLLNLQSLEKHRQIPRLYCLWASGTRRNTSQEKLLGISQSRKVVGEAPALYVVIQAKNKRQQRQQ